MAKRRKIVRRRAAAPAEELEQEDVDVEEMDDDEEEEVVVRAARKVVVEPELEDDEDIGEDEEEVEIKPVRRTRKVTPPVVTKAVEEEPEVAKPVRIKKVETQVTEDVLTGVLNALETGQAIQVSRTADNQWQIVRTDKISNKLGFGKLTGKEYWDTVLSPEFTKWQEEWAAMTFAEKKKQATKIKAVWEPHDNPKIEIMRITAAMREHLGIEKYKPEYASRGARAALKG
jgi:hypothetical protein